MAQFSSRLDLKPGWLPQHAAMRHPNNIWRPLLQRWNWRHLSREARFNWRKVYAANTVVNTRDILRSSQGRKQTSSWRNICPGNKLGNSSPWSPTV